MINSLISGSAPVPHLKSNSLYQSLLNPVTTSSVLQAFGNICLAC